MWVIWFLSFAVVLFFDCFFFVGQHRETRPRSEAREGFRTISVCLGNRAGLIVDAMLDPVSQQPYRVFFSWSRRQAGQPARLTVEVTVRNRWRGTLSDRNDLSAVIHTFILLAPAAGRDFCQCRHEKSRPDAVKDCPRRGHLFSVNIQPYLASPFPAVWSETSIHHVPQRSSPTGGPSEQQGTPPGGTPPTRLEDGTAKATPAAQTWHGPFMTTALARAQCAMDDGRLRRQSVFFDPPNGVARKRETAPWSPRHHHPALGDIRDGALRNHTSHLCVAQNLLDTFSTGQASNLSITTSITELAERGMERIRQALRRRPGGTKARRHSALAHHVSGRKRSLLPGTDYRLLPTDGECHQRHVSPDGDMTKLP